MLWNSHFAGGYWGLKDEYDMILTITKLKEMVPIATKNKHISIPPKSNMDWLTVIILKQFVNDACHFHRKFSHTVRLGIQSLGVFNAPYKIIIL